MTDVELWRAITASLLVVAAVTVVVSCWAVVESVLWVGGI
jgi:hypothetical protein